MRLPTFNLKKLRGLTLAQLLREQSRLKHHMDKLNGITRKAQAGIVSQAQWGQIHKAQDYASRANDKLKRAIGDLTYQWSANDWRTFKEAQAKAPKPKARTSTSPTKRAPRRSITGPKARPANKGTSLSAEARAAWAAEHGFAVKDAA